MKIKIRNKKIVVGAFALVIACSFIASAALLPYFNKGTTTAKVLQSIVVSTDGETWLDYNEPFTTTIDDMIHCTDYCYKRWVWNRACEDAPVLFEIIEKQAPGGNDWEGFDINQFLFGETQTIRLVQKDVVFGQSPWLELEDGMEAYLTFGTCGKYFVWDVTGFDYKIGEDYALIYYANYPEYWDAAPAVVLGYLSDTIKSVDVPTMPYVDDENAQRPIIDEGESYCHQYGAKFWLVPASAVEEGDVDWERASEFLFETDLGFYMDCDEMNPEPLPNVWPIFNLLDCGNVATLKSEHIYCWITCNHVDIGIMPGTYKYEQYLSLFRPQPREEEPEI